MTVAARADCDGSPPLDNVVSLHGVAWADYERLLEIRGDRAVPRYTYLEGELEIMSPSRMHESIKSMISRLVEVWCSEHGIEFNAFGSWTYNDEARRCGVEPDECYVFGCAADAKVPHLAIEVIANSGGGSKLHAYEKLGVSEVWFWSRGWIQIYAPGSAGYIAVEQSRVLPGVNLRQLEHYIESPTTSQAVGAYRAALRKRAM